MKTLKLFFTQMIPILVLSGAVSMMLIAGGMETPQEKKFNALHKWQLEKSSATVEQKEGVYIFMFSKPASEYQYLGSVKKTGIVMSGKPEEMFNTLLRRCKKEYPGADGLIFTSVDMEKADCIKLKD